MKKLFFASVSCRSKHNVHRENEMNIYIPRNVYTFNIIPSSTELEKPDFMQTVKTPTDVVKAMQLL